LAAELAVTKGFISDLEQGRKPLSLRTEKQIISHFGLLSESWWKTGKGAMLREDPPPTPTKKVESDMEVRLSMLEELMGVGRKASKDLARLVRGYLAADDKRKEEALKVLEQSEPKAAKKRRRKAGGGIA